MLKGVEWTLTLIFQHRLLHGETRWGRQVGKQLQLSPRQCLPMVVPFERFGNTSSSSTWRDPVPGGACAADCDTGAGHRTLKRKGHARQGIVFVGRHCMLGANICRCERSRGLTVGPHGDVPGRDLHAHNLK